MTAVTAEAPASLDTLKQALQEKVDYAIVGARVIACKGTCDDGECRRARAAITMLEAAFRVIDRAGTKEEALAAYLHCWVELSGIPAHRRTAADGRN